MVGVGSPTEPQGSRTSFIHGVVTVPPNDRILAGAGGGRGEGCKNDEVYKDRDIEKGTIKANCINTQTGHTTNRATA